MATIIATTFSSSWTPLKWKKAINFSYPSHNIFSLKYRNILHLSQFLFSKDVALTNSSCTPSSKTLVHRNCCAHTFPTSFFHKPFPQVSSTEPFENLVIKIWLPNPHPFGIILHSKPSSSSILVARVFSNASTLDSIILVVIVCNNLQSLDWALIPIYRNWIRKLKKAKNSWEIKLTVVYKSLKSTKFYLYTSGTLRV